MEIEKIVNFESTTLVLLAAASLILLAAVKNITNKAPKPPGPLPWPVFGNAPSLGANPHLAFQKMSQRYGPIFQIKLGGVKAVVLSDYSVIREALCKQKDVFHGRPAFSSYEAVSAGQSVVFSDVRNHRMDWRKDKSTIIRHLHLFATSVKSRDHLNSLVTKHTMAMARELEANLDARKSREDVIRRNMANTVCNICLGKSFGQENQEFQELLSMNGEFGEILECAPLVDSMPWLTRLPFLKYKKAMADYYRINTMLDDWTKKRVIEALQDFDASRVTNIVHSLAADHLNNNVCDDKHNMLSESELANVTALTEDIFGAGQHTVSMSLAWMLTYMQAFPAATQNMRAEIQGVVGERLPTLSDRKDLPTVESFVHEVFRHATITPCTIPHCALQDTVLCGYFIPKGMMIMVDQYSANHDSKVWKNPDAFEPERFIITDDQSHKKINKLMVEKYLAFSIGPRKCPGAELAKSWLILTLAILIQTCWIEPENGVPNIKAKYGLVMQPQSLSFNLKIKDNFKQTTSTN